MTKMPNFIEVTGGPVTLVFSSKGRTFFSERLTGNIWELIDEEKYKLIRHLPVVHVTGHHETGIIGIALDPNFDSNSLMYAYFTRGDDIDRAENIVTRFSLATSKEEILLAGIPAGRIHNGGIIKFGPDGKLYIGVGVGNQVMKKAQDIDYLAGKILRINPDGTIPDDNPFPNSPVYSFGHRNIFGLAFNPANNKLYICEEGPDTDDEINIIEAGGNYGWPKSMGFNYGADSKKYIDPITSYTPVITPTQSVFSDGDLYFGAFNEGTVHKLILSDDGRTIESDTIVYRGRPFGVTGVFVSPDEEFFVTTTSSINKISI